MRRNKLLLCLHCSLFLLPYIYLVAYSLPLHTDTYKYMYPNSIPKGLVLSRKKGWSDRPFPALAKERFLVKGRLGKNLIVFVVVKVC